MYVDRYFRPTDHPLRRRARRGYRGHRSGRTFDRCADCGDPQRLARPSGAALPWPVAEPGTVGALQFEVIQYRLEHEYGAKCRYENLNVHKACWVEPADSTSDEFADFKRTKSKFLAKDKRGQLVFFADSAFTLQMTQSKYPTVKLHFVSEFETAD